MPSPGEFEIIERWFSRPSTDAAIRVGIGDDAAIVALQGPVAIAVDTLVAGTHFPPELEAAAIGHRVLAVNLSDLAAMGAKPRWATLALTLPDVDTDWLTQFAAGLFALAERSGVSLIGGDTTRGPLTLTLQLMGDVAKSPLLRSGGQAGDRIFVSGTLGDSAAALAHFATPAAERSDEAAALVERFSYPEPRVALGQALAELAHAAIDVSDGLLADLGHLCRQSGCGAAIDPKRLPLSTALTTLYEVERARDFALRGGDDYELCFAVAPGDVEAVRQAATRVSTEIAEIGELTADGGADGGAAGRIVDRRDGREFSSASGGFVHF